jgi:hypothetical protein
VAKLLLPETDPGTLNLLQNGEGAEVEGDGDAFLQLLLLTLEPQVSANVQRAPSDSPDLEVLLLIFKNLTAEPALADRDFLMEAIDLYSGTIL